MAKNTKATTVADLKKGDNVIMKGFTGMKLGVFPVVEATEKSVTIAKKDGTKVKFSRKTGKQISGIVEGKEKFANSIMPDDGSYVAPERKAPAKKADAKTTKSKAKAKVEEPEDDEDEEEEEEEVKPAKKSKKPAKKAKKEVEEDDEDEEEDDDSEYEEA